MGLLEVKICKKFDIDCLLKLLLLGKVGLINAKLF